MHQLMHQPRAVRADIARWRRREPEKTVLYQILQEHLETFLALGDADPGRSALPGFVARELRRYLACGILARG